MSNAESKILESLCWGESSFMGTGSKGSLCSTVFVCANWATKMAKRSLRADGICIIIEGAAVGTLLQTSLVTLRVKLVCLRGNIIERREGVVAEAAASLQRGMEDQGMWWTGTRSFLA